jgi:putative phosphoribosyl transferase
MATYEDRREAGQQLAETLSAYANRNDVIVLALPRGGVPVAFEVAKMLHAPLDVYLVRKLGVPGHEELAMGAIASGGVRVLNDQVVEKLNISESVIDGVAQQEQIELERREDFYRNGRPATELAGQTVILVDDGIATGSSMRAAVEGVRAQGAAQVVVSVPVAAFETYLEFRSLVDDMICVQTPEQFYAVGLWYDDFSQTTDEEVRDLLDRAAAEHQTTAG